MNAMNVSARSYAVSRWACWASVDLLTDVAVKTFDLLSCRAAA